uniref:Granulins domain-containing protein n=1 Tax=Strigamia maritima TaxID=126957 RepID=T1IJ47_STRMM
MLVGFSVRPVIDNALMEVTATMGVRVANFQQVDGYGCCPYPSATCCSDGAHCCPEGYTCNVAHGKCNPQSLLARLQYGQSEMRTKIPAIKSESNRWRNEIRINRDVLFCHLMKKICNIKTYKS